ncbi:imidazoleglycerol-phosphate dehydratase 1, chloroplastic isoform X2 [Spinacia oleracea]|uniref:Imidazoleglycerol-phosphate dehydratase n=1 Tax=Spinacia oleracea TaxID=3562 RepID=A0A9R0K419_SPIOL|nr:imidazoleglycerol-phosphate dehydratase 1, chloroplastic-like isoform X2 [Spinacia oleracea]
MALCTPGGCHLLTPQIRVFPSTLSPLPAQLPLFHKPNSKILKLTNSTIATPRASMANDNGSPSISASQYTGRIGKVKRVTKETNVFVKINLDGKGVADSSTSVPFLDHMLDQLASHGLFDVHVRATGDIHIDDHHTNEDIALALGTALLQALGDRKGINRFGDFSAPLDEALIHVSLDLSGRPHLSYDLQFPTERVGTYDTQLVEHFFQSLVNTSGMTLHIRQLAGKNSHHIIEATFKAFARALRQATEYDHRRAGTVPSSKGVLSRA